MPILEVDVDNIWDLSENICLRKQHEYFNSHHRIIDLLLMNEPATWKLNNELFYGF